MLNTKKVLALTLTLLFVFALIPAAAQAAPVYRTLDEIKADGTINIGVFSDKNPFSYVDENGEYQGYDVYFAERIGKDLGVKINYVSTEAANRVEYLETGKVDIILANFTVTPERAEKVDFALPYMNVALGVVSPDSRVITDLSELSADDPVIVISGTTAETYLIANNPEVKLQKYDTYANAKNALENGNGVAWANDNTEVIAFALQNTGYTVGIPSLGSQEMKSSPLPTSSFSTRIMRLHLPRPTALTMRTAWWSRAASPQSKGKEFTPCLSTNLKHCSSTSVRNRPTPPPTPGPCPSTRPPPTCSITPPTRRPVSA